MAQTKLGFNLDFIDEATWLTVTAAQAARSSIAYVQELGNFPCGPKYYTRRENLPSYLIKLCIGGKGLLEYNGQVHTITPGQVFWIDCMKPQYYRTAPDAENWHLLWVHLDGATCEAYYNLFLAQNDSSPVLTLDSDVSIRSTLDMLINLYKSGGNTLQDDIQASNLLTQLMTRCIQSAGLRSIGRLPSYVMDARSYINLHYAERITLDDMARVISINKFYLQKLFKHHMGLSPNEYLIYTRLNRAKQLLRTTAHPISQIAMDVGISNIGHFINLFKKYEGITPNTYRQRWYNSDESGQSI